MRTGWNLRWSLTRWFDLVRTGRAQAVLGITDPNKLVFPLPIVEVNLSNGNLPQNTGY